MSVQLPQNPELSVKSIARSAEEAYLEYESFGITDEITCEDVSDISKREYETCKIDFDEDGIASVTYVGKGNYKGLSVCFGTKINATAIESLLLQPPDKVFAF